MLFRKVTNWVDVNLVLKMIFNYRFFWCLMLTASLFFCGMNISGLYEKLQKNPISVSQSDKLYNIDQVCAQNLFIHLRFLIDFFFRSYHFQLLHFQVTSSLMITDFIICSWKQCILVRKTNQAWVIFIWLMIKMGLSKRWFFSSLLFGLKFFSSLLTQILVCRNQILFSWLYDFFNLSLKVHENIRNLSQSEWIENGSFLWKSGIKEVEVPLSQILTKRGIGFNFNILDANQLLRLSK